MKYRGLASHDTETFRSAHQYISFIVTKKTIIDCHVCLQLHLLTFSIRFYIRESDSSCLLGLSHHKYALNYFQLTFNFSSSYCAIVYVKRVTNNDYISHCWSIEQNIVLMSKFPMLCNINYRVPVHSEKQCDGGNKRMKYQHVNIMAICSEKW